MYDHLVGSLTWASARLVLDLLKDQDKERLLTGLKKKLLSSHKLTNIKRIKKLMWIEPLGGCKPTELLAETMPGNKYVFCSETSLTGESRFHISTVHTPLGIEPGSLMTGSKRVDHWTSGTMYEV
jgi:hypothetical protein